MKAWILQLRPAAMKNVSWPFFILIFSLTACNSKFEVKPAPVTSTYTPSTPTVSKVGDYDVVQGAIQIQDMTATYDPAESSLSLHGRVNMKPVDGANSLAIDLDMRGTENEKGFAILSARSQQAALPADVKVGAKATCLGEQNHCVSSFIDIYVQYHGKVYHHQVESQDEEKVSAPGSVAKTTPKADSKADSKAAPDKKSDEKKTSEPPQKNAPEPAPKKNEGEKSKTPTPSTLPTPPSPARSAPLPDSATANKPKASASNPVAPAPAKPSAVPAPAPVKPSEPKAAPPTKIPAEVKPATKSGSSDEEDDDDESEDDVEQGPGRYIGDMQGDIEQVFNENKQQIPATSNPAVQVIGSANHGRLTNASDLLAYEKTHNPSGIHVIYPERKTYYGSTELIYLIAHLGVYTQELIPNYVLQISDLSHEKGGPLGHRSHQSGIDADIAFYFKDPAKQQKLVSALSGGKTGTPIESWMVEEQWKLFKYAVNSKYVDRIFIHPNLKKSLCELATKSGELKAAQKGDVVYETLRRLRPEKSHYNHFHLRVKCSKAQIRCLQMADPPPGTGC